MSNFLFIHYFKLRQQNVRECQSSWARFQSFWFRVHCAGCSHFRFMIKTIKSVSMFYCWYDVLGMMSKKKRIWFSLEPRSQKQLHSSFQLNLSRLSKFVSVTSNPHTHMLFNSPIATVPERTRTHALHTYWAQSDLVIQVRTIYFPLWLLFFLLAKTKPVSHWTIQRLFVLEKLFANLDKGTVLHTSLSLSIEAADFGFRLQWQLISFFTCRK